MSLLLLAAGMVEDILEGERNPHHLGTVFPKPFGVQGCDSAQQLKRLPGLGW